MSRVAARLAPLAVLAALVLGITAAGGASASLPRPAIGGVVPHAGMKTSAGPLKVALRRSPCDPPLCWVMRTNTTYAIYWVPSGQTVQAGYENAINQYLTDVAAASGSQTNVYSVATQYYDSTGFITYQSTFGGSLVDTDPYPASGCQVTPVCLTDDQLHTEIQKVITENGWTDGPDSLFFIFTPDGVSSCFQAAGVECSTNFYCAYHSGFTGTDGKPILYANEPYNAAINECHNQPGQTSPNGDDADATINTMSHEQSEAITDPWGNGWLDAGGEEVADICAWDFGTPLGTAANGQTYNQLINGHEYELQQIYSNDGAGCRQQYVGHPANTVLPKLTGVAVQKQTLSASQGAWTQLPTRYAYRWLRCNARGIACKAISGAKSTTYTVVAADGEHTLKVRVAATNARGTTQVASRPTRAVVGVPASRKAPRITGRAEIGQRLNAGRGSWSGPPDTYRYQWLRCDVHGVSCVRIDQATHPRYRLTRSDARHRLRVLITAVNVAGSKTATSHSTARIAVAKS